MPTKKNEIFRNTRKAAGLTQEQAGEMLNRKERMIRRWENEESPMPDWALEAFINALQSRKESVQ